MTMQLDSLTSAAGYVEKIDQLAAENKRLRALLQQARDYIGAMPTLDATGDDRFLQAAGVVERIEAALATHEQSASGEVAK